MANRPILAQVDGIGRIYFREPLVARPLICSHAFMVCDDLQMIYEVYAICSAVVGVSVALPRSLMRSGMMSKPNQMCTDCAAPRSYSSDTSRRDSGTNWHTRLVRMLNNYSQRERAYQNELRTSLPKVIWEEGRVVALSHTYAVKFPLVTMASQICPKNTPSRGPIPKHHYGTYLIREQVRPMKPNCIRIQSAVFPQCTGQIDRPTDRSSTGKFDDCRPLRYESDAA